MLGYIGSSVKLRTSQLGGLRDASLLNFSSSVENRMSGGKRAAGRWWTGEGTGRAKAGEDALPEVVKEAR